VNEGYEISDMNDDKEIVMRGDNDNGGDLILYLLLGDNIPP